MLPSAPELQGFSVWLAGKNTATPFPALWEPQARILPDGSPPSTRLIPSPALVAPSVDLWVPLCNFLPSVLHTLAPWPPQALSSAFPNHGPPGFPQPDSWPPATTQLRNHGAHSMDFRLFGVTV